jgi:maltose-binding protein MalE
VAAARLPFVSQSAEILERAVTRPQIPLYSQVSRQLQSMLEAVLTGRLAPAQAAAHAAELIEAITSGLPIVHERARKPPTAAIDTAA